MSKKTILIGEDEQNIAEMYKIAFEQAGYHVVSAANGNEVIENGRKVKPNLIFLDINMPVKDGFDVLREISEKLPLYKIFKHIPIIMLSNYSNQQDIDFCLKNGAQDYLVKSDYTPSAIVKMAQKYLDDYDE